MLTEQEYEMIKMELLGIIKKEVQEWKLLKLLRH